MRLWSVWKGNLHIGYALGDTNAKSILNAIDPDYFQIYVSSYPVPTRWASQWIAIWKSAHVGSGGQWGAFKDGWHLWVSRQLQKTYGYGLAATREGHTTTIARY